MTSGRILTGLALAAVAVVTALVVVAVGWEGDTGEETAGGTLPTSTTTTSPDGETEPFPEPGRPSAPPPAISVRGAMSPRILLFGDMMRARVDVVLDTARVDPDSVRVAAAFAPWEVVGQPQQTRRDAGSNTVLRTTYLLRCFTSPCLPPGEAAQLEFDPARVSYAAPGAGEGTEARESLRIDWPVVTLYSRYASASFAGREGLTTPWRADLTTMPAVGYRAPPGLLLGLLLAVGALLVAGGGYLVYRAWPRRVHAPRPEPEPEPLPPPLPPLLLALVLLEDAARADGAEDRRRALELVAEALTEHGDEDLAHSAKILAWSEADPEVEDTTGLAARVRATLEVEDLVPLVPEENGRVV